MKKIDKIIRENINRYLKEEFFYNVPPRERRFYKNMDDSQINWVRVGETSTKIWSEQEKKFVIEPIYFEFNESQAQEIEEFKHTHDISQYVRLIQEIQKDYNVLNRDLFRFVDKEGVRHGVDIRYMDEKDINLYDEYKGTVFEDMLLGYNADKENYHKEFMKKLNTNGDKIILLHSSSDKITNGRICSSSGQHKLYTPKSDLNYTYFWASGVQGSDNSGGEYSYYCAVSPNEIYDYSTNLENFASQDEALERYKFIAYYWKDEDVIVAKTKSGAEISYIEFQGHTYDKNWNEIG